MNEKPLIKGFLRNVFGLGKAGVKSPPEEGRPEITNGVPLAVPTPKPPTPRTEAYLNRKKGRKQHEDRVQDLQRIIGLIQSQGEVTPGELAQELGMSRSTLTYNLKRLLAHTPGDQKGWKKYHNSHLWDWLLGQKRVERLGAGQNVRYRIVEVPQQGQEGLE